MIARHEGQVVLVSGAMPGERVLARVERTERRLAFASVVDVQEESPDRRAAFADSACGGCVYSHIVYPRQLALKADIVRDAFLRLGRIPIDGPIPVAPSPERGYRMRARFHVDGMRFGFYREGTHALCDAASTEQVSDTALESVSSAVKTLVAAGARIDWVELTESVDGSERALAVAVDDVTAIAAGALAPLAAGSGLVGCAIQDRRSRVARGWRALGDRRVEPAHARARAGWSASPARGVVLSGEPIPRAGPAARRDGRGGRRTRARPVRRRRPVLGRVGGVRQAGSHGRRGRPDEWGRSRVERTKRCRGRSRPDGHPRQRRRLPRGQAARLHRESPRSSSIRRAPGSRPRRWRRS